MILGRLRHWSAQLRVIDERTQRLEAAETSRDSAVQALRELLEEQSRTLQSLTSSVESLRGMQAQADQNACELHGMALHIQNLAGETLTALNAQRELDDMARRTLGQIEARQLRLASEASWQENQFQVYSQFGEDGLLQFLFRELPDVPRRFVEFGVEDYKQANTRFLLLQGNGWSGLVMDGSKENIAAIHRDSAYLWRDLKAVAAWISRDNINDVLAEQGMAGEIGLLAIDIDGNDYWVWEAITAVDPVVVVVEYNYRFGRDIAAVVPYDPAFDKRMAHPSGIYYGASLRALTDLGNRKGYAFVGCSRGGVNAFFVRRDRLQGRIREMSLEEGYLPGEHAEMIDPALGIPVKATLEEQQRLILSLPLVWIGGEERAAGAGISD